MDTFAQTAIVTTYILVLLCAVAAVIGFAISALQNTKMLLYTVLGLVAFVAVFSGMYVASSGDLLPAYAKGGVTEPGTSKFVEAIVLLFYTMVILGIVCAAYHEISKIFK